MLEDISERPGSQANKSVHMTAVDPELAMHSTYDVTFIAADWLPASARAAHASAVVWNTQQIQFCAGFWLVRTGLLFGCAQA